MQIVTGIVLLMYYNPHIDLAFDNFSYYQQLPFFTVCKSFVDSLLHKGQVGLKGLPRLGQLSKALSDVNIDKVVSEPDLNIKSIDDSTDSSVLVSNNPFPSIKNLSTVFDLTATQNSPKSYISLDLENGNFDISAFINKQVLDSFVLSSGHHILIYEFTDLFNSKNYVAILGFFTSKNELQSSGGYNSVVKTTPVSISSDFNVVRGTLYDFDSTLGQQNFSLILRNRGIIIMDAVEYASFKIRPDSFFNKGKTSAEVQTVLEKDVIFDVNTSSSISYVGKVSHVILRQVLQEIRYIVLPSNTFVNNSMNPAGSLQSAHIQKVAFTRAFNLHKVDNSNETSVISSGTNTNVPSSHFDDVD